MGPSNFQQPGTLGPQVSDSALTCADGSGASERSFCGVGMWGSGCFEHCLVLFTYQVLLWLWVLSPGGNEGQGCPETLGSPPTPGWSS